MAVKQIDGSAVTNTSTKNNIGTIRGGGTIVSPLWTSQNVGDTANSAFGTGPKLGTAGMAKAVSAGTFAVMEAGSYIIRKVTTTLAGVANTVLRSGASDFGHRRSIHSIQSVRNSFLTTQSWAYVNGVLTYTNTVTNSHTAYSADNAAAPTLAVPGELTYLPNGKTPYNDNYKEKTSA